MLAQGVMFVAGVWAAWQFFAAAEMLIALKWGLSATVLLLMAGMLKLSLMPQIQADRLLRELKRVELLILHRAGE
jgi:branched-subunit amino acid ABC-type transport system permease component